MGYRIAVIGAGSWGAALALLLAERDNEIRLWVYEKELADLIKNKRENALYLPGHTIPENIYPTNSLREAIDSCDIIVSVVPSHAVRSVFTQIREYMPDVPILSATKGIEVETLQTVSQILGDIFPRYIPRRFASLSGPSFAGEVAKGLPTAITLATGDEPLAKEMQRLFARPYFRVYTNPDVIGVEIGGALKNVIVIGN